MSPAARTVVRGGTVADGAGGLCASDVAVVGDSIDAVGEIAARPGDVVIDAEGRLVLPGLIDAHSHAEAAVYDEEIALALLRQGVTTVITGQDGVSFAPGDGRYATDYFAGLLGRHPRYTGGGVAALLAGYDGATGVNVAYLVPHGTVRHQVLGDARRPPDPAELARMVGLVQDGLDAGAVGLSTGLDYAPGYFAEVAELVAVSRPVAVARALHVSHLRGGYEDNLAAGVDELIEIARGSGVSVHISHLHGRAALIASALADARKAGVDLSFDAYPYRRGCSLLAMPMLPARLLELGTAAVAERLGDPAIRAAVVREQLPQLLSRPDLGSDWAAGIIIAGVDAEPDRWTEGLTLASAASRADTEPADFALQLIARSRLAVSAVLRVPTQRSTAELAEIFTRADHVGGSDGIYTGGAPHPRGWGTFARYLSRYTRDRGDYSWGAAAVHLAGRPAARHGLGDRGRITPGRAADLILLDPATVADRADYQHPRELAVGIDDVLVNGIPVLAGGQLTGARPGRGLRRSASVRKLTPEETP